MLDTIKINTTEFDIVKDIQVQDVYGNYYTVQKGKYPDIPVNERRFIKSAPYLIQTMSYYPTITFRPYRLIYIEFSAPKVLFDNNVEELCNTDFNKFLDTLRNKLLTMGLDISIDSLVNARVSHCTVSKNIITDDIDVPEFIEFTRRLWWRWRKSKKLKTFDNDGIAVRNYTGTTSIGIYDKVAELKADRNKTLRECEIESKLNRSNILRFEYRMQNYQRMKAKYSWAKGIKLEIVRLADIFDSELSKKIILEDLNKTLFSEEFKLIPIYLSTIKGMYEYLFDKGLKPNEEFAVITAFRLCSDMGIEYARKVFKERYSESMSKRVYELCKQVFEQFKSYEYFDIIDKVKANMNEYLSVQLKPVYKTLNTSTLFNKW